MTTIPCEGTYNSGKIVKALEIYQTGSWVNLGIGIDPYTDRIIMGPSALFNVLYRLLTTQGLLSTSDLLYVQTELIEDQSLFRLGAISDKWQLYLQTLPQPRQVSECSVTLLPALNHFALLFYVQDSVAPASVATSTRSVFKLDLSLLVAEALIVTLIEHYKQIIPPDHAPRLQFLERSLTDTVAHEKLSSVG